MKQILIPPRLKRIGRSAVLYTIFLLVYHLSYEAALGRFSLLESAIGTFFQEVPVWLPRLTHILILPTTFYSVSRLFAIHDTNLKKQRPTDEDSPVNWFVQTEEFRLETGVILALTAFLPTGWCDGGLFTLLPMHFLLAKFCQILLFSPLLTVINIYGHRSAGIIWETPKKRFWEKTPPAIRFVKDLVFILAAYFLGFLLLPVFLPMIHSTLYLLAQVVWAFRYILLSGFIILTLFLYGRAWRIRQRFIKELKTMAQDKKSHFRISPIKKARLSLFFPSRRANFTVHVRDKTYSVRLMADPLRFRTMYFGPEGTGIKHSSLNFRGMELFNIDIPFTYEFEGEGEKLILISPVPKFICSVSRNHTADLDVGDRVGDYRLFNGSGFLGMLERDCLER